MYRKAFIVLALFAAMPGQAPPAFASVPSVLLSTTTTGDRYQSQVTFTYAAPVSVTDEILSRETALSPGDVLVMSIRE